MYYIIEHRYGDKARFSKGYPTPRRARAARDRWKAQSKRRGFRYHILVYNGCTDRFVDQVDERG